MNSKVVKSTGRKKPPNAGKGRKKGVPNKTTALLKDAILKAAEAAGDDLPAGDEKQKGLINYLRVQAKDNPGPFMALLGKVLPLQLTSEGDMTVTFNTLYEAEPGSNPPPTH